LYTTHEACRTSSCPAKYLRLLLFNPKPTRLIRPSNQALQPYTNIALAKAYWKRVKLAIRLPSLPSYICTVWTTVGPSQWCHRC